MAPRRRWRKQNPLYVCTECGGQVLQWQASCPHCRLRTTLDTGDRRGSGARGRQPLRRGSRTPARPQRLSEVEAREESRIASGIEEFDRVLGGGLVPGRRRADRRRAGHRQVHAAAAGACRDRQVAPGAVRERRGVAAADRAAREAARRRRAASVIMLPDTDLARIEAAIKSEKPEVAVIDSIQTLYFGELQSAPGSVAQVRECAARLTRVAKSTGVRDGVHRSRHQGGHARRPARARAHGGHGALFRRRHAFALPADPRLQEPLRRGERAGRVRDGRRRG